MKRPWQKFAPGQPLYHQASTALTPFPVSLATLQAARAADSWLTVDEWESSSRPAEQAAAALPVRLLPPSAHQLY